ncbi:MAG: phosphopantetheine-binding protein [Thermodesulfobacteriota bacterium]
MEQQQIFDKVLTIITPYVRDTDNLENVTINTAILDDLHVNSARLVDIIIEFEDAFDIEIDDDDADQIRTVGDAVSYISSRVSSGQSAASSVDGAL